MNDTRAAEQHIGVSALRQFNADRLRALDHVVIVHDGPTPVRALVPYEMFMWWQKLSREIANG